MEPSDAGGNVLFTLLTRLAALGHACSGPIPGGAMLPTDSIAAITAGQYLRVPVLAGNTRDEGKLFPTFLPLLGGPVGAQPSGHPHQRRAGPRTHLPGAAKDMWLKATSITRC